MKSIEDILSERVRDAAAGALGMPVDGAVHLEVSNRPDLGDFATSVAFTLAKAARRPPLAVAELIAAALGGAAGDGAMIAGASASAPGFVNVRLSAAELSRSVDGICRAGGRIAQRAPTGDKVVVEHTNINPNKAAHVGHFRNACLGDSVVRILRRLGHTVEVQNYIDDTGVQVADVVVGLRFLEVPPQGDQPFDRYCSDVYVAVQHAYAADPALLARRREVQASVEEGHGPLAAFVHDVAGRIVTANLATMARAGIGYDVLTWESHILGLGFWQTAFERLRDGGALRFETDGPNAGCWVVPFGAGTVELEGKTVSEDKVLVTSQGTITYTAKDIAYQLWKFGLLGRDFSYRLWGAQADGRPLWTTALDDGSPDAPAFAHGDRVVNVIDVRQSYPQQVVYECLRRLGFAAQADRSHHLAYGVVNLSAAAARELGVAVDEGQAVVAMSGRGGIQVFADELLDRLAARLAERTADPDVASAVAVGAARYYMLKCGNTQDIAFDFDDALRTTGETGVYLQYALVRARGILRRLAEAGVSAAPAPPPPVLADADRALVLHMLRWPRALATAGDALTAQPVAKFAFELAAAFSAFYDNTGPIVQETDAGVQAWRAGLVQAFDLLFGDVLDTLGIPALDRI
ncbi:MAG: arginine--tRNA ligase [Ardenticatenales bacterium]|nr:arginine--tRNA ligase [Ardenticatenales bacterium]